MHMIDIAEIIREGVGGPSQINWIFANRIPFSRTGKCKCTVFNFSKKNRVKIKSSWDEDRRARQDRSLYVLCRLIPCTTALVQT